MTDAYRTLRKYNEAYLLKRPDSPYWFYILKPNERKYTIGDNDINPPEIDDTESLTLDEMDFTSLLFNYINRVGGEISMYDDINDVHAGIRELVDKVYDTHLICDRAHDILASIGDKQVLMIFEADTCELQMVCLYDLMGGTHLRYTFLLLEQYIESDIQSHVQDYFNFKYPKCQFMAATIRTNHPIIDNHVQSHTLYKLATKLPNTTEPLSFQVVMSDNKPPSVVMDTVVMPNRDIRFVPITLSNWDQYIDDIVYDSNPEDKEAKITPWKKYLISLPYFTIQAIVEKIHDVDVVIGNIIYTVHTDKPNSCIYLHIHEDFRNQGIGSAAMRTMEHQLTDINSYPLIKIVMTAPDMLPFLTDKNGYQINSCDLMVNYPSQWNHPTPISPGVTTC